MTFSEAELVAALQTAMEPGEDADGMTTREMCAAIGIGNDLCRNLLRGLVADGKVTPVRVARVNLAGILQRIPGYQLVDLGQSTLA